MKKIIAITTLALGLAPFLANAQVSADADVNVSAGAAVTAPTPAPGTSIQQTNRAAMFAARQASSSARQAYMAARQASSTAMRQDRMENRVGQATDRGNQEIAVRIQALNALAARIQAMKNVSATQKANVATEVQTEITTLTALQAKIDAEASSTTSMGTSSALREDVQSITIAYRIYALIIPQASILSAADRVTTLANSFTEVSAKLQTRIAAAQTAGKDVTALTASLNDITAKVADAQTQAQTAVTAVSGLTPDNGDTTIAASNKAALQTGNAAIKAAQADFQAADKDAKSIISAVEAFHLNAGASAAVTTGATTSVQ